MFRRVTERISIWFSIHSRPLTQRVRLHLGNLLYLVASHLENQAFDLHNELDWDLYYKARTASSNTFSDDEDGFAYFMNYDDDAWHYQDQDYSTWETDLADR